MNEFKSTVYNNEFPTTYLYRECTIQRSPITHHYDIWQLRTKGFRGGKIPCKYLGSIPGFNEAKAFVDNKYLEGVLL